MHIQQLISLGLPFSCFVLFLLLTIKKELKKIIQSPTVQRDASAEVTCREQNSMGKLRIKQYIVLSTGDIIK